ncbi:hypothetical protein C789_4683 [Microcystis aeruginosa FACHB-905 = DIANCHI905]|uniref:Uncharacterized protein n=1 Tax=Microcystis aeruginosa PCC 7806SL TaxID=1903187 RepID=A0AB33BNI7_MICA7|nr:hypothetical protein BH695_0398 [Microcystis aeruginosa PCC 7806SL]ELS45506.1 hypothetical protein C789_4683 [Microcystis aeruginosa FACHB-905 = DIANCHI905]
MPESLQERLSWIWWVKCILRYSPAGEGVEGTTPDTEDTKIDRFYGKLS